MQGWGHSLREDSASHCSMDYVIQSCPSAVLSYVEPYRSIMRIVTWRLLLIFNDHFPFKKHIYISIELKCSIQLFLCNICFWESWVTTYLVTFTASSRLSLSFPKVLHCRHME